MREPTDAMRHKLGRIGSSSSSAPRVSWVGLAAFTVAVTIATVTVACGSDKTIGANRGQAESPVTEATPHQAWIVTDGSSPATASPAPPEGSSGPAITPNGPLARELDAIVKRSSLIPSERSPEKAQDIDGVGAMAIYALPSGYRLTTVRQKLTAPMSLLAITLGSNLDRYEKWPSGTQAVLVEHAKPVIQVVMVRPNGTMLQIGLAFNPLDPPKGTPEYSADSLAEVMKQRVDNPTVDLD